jgi:hypothetical protein
VIEQSHPPKGQHSWSDGECSGARRNFGVVEELRKGGEGRREKKYEVVFFKDVSGNFLTKFRELERDRWD